MTTMGQCQNAWSRWLLRACVREKKKKTQSGWQVGTHMGFRQMDVARSQDA